MVNLAHYPQLKLIAWHLGGVEAIDEREAFALYERNWKWVDEKTLTEQEKQLIAELTKTYGGGLMNV